MPLKKRIDLLLHERGLTPSREKARAMIMAGEIQVNGQIVDKPGQQVSAESEITIRAKPRFVSRGGEKLAAALSAFDINIQDYICADVGASTGGFTDCLLQAGASRVYAIDVGYGQLDYTLRQNPKVIVIERTNARYLSELPERVNLVTLDASFISLKVLLPVIKAWLLPKALVIPLIKPQFEAGREDVGKGGVVKNPDIHKRVLQEVLSFAREQDMDIAGLIRSPLKGPAGNTEFLPWLKYGHPNDSYPDLSDMIQAVV